MPEPKTNFPWYVFVIVIAGGALMILGGVIALINPAMLLPKGDVITGAVRVYAGYLISRNIAIGGMLLGALFLRARASLSTMMLLAGIIQLLDALVDIADGRLFLVPGVAVLGVAFLLARRKLW